MLQKKKGRRSAKEGHEKKKETRGNDRSDRTPSRDKKTKIGVIGYF